MSESASTPLLEATNTEAIKNRNPPRALFAATEASRPPYSHDTAWQSTKSPNPTWAPGDGGTPSLPSTSVENIVHIDPSAPGRETVQNYKLMLSTTVPRPIALVSTVSKDGKSTNLAPFAYFMNVCSEPCLYSLSFVGKARGEGWGSDTLENLVETGECAVSVVGDWFVEAAIYTSTNAPPGTSEWSLSGLHPLPSILIKPTYVAESAFSVECKLVSKQEIRSPVTGERTAVLCIVEAVQFHVRKEVLVGGRDGEQAEVDIERLRPIWRGGGLMFGTLRTGYEILRPEPFGRDREKEEVKKLIKEKVDGQ